MGEASSVLGLLPGPEPQEARSRPVAACGSAAIWERIRRRVQDRLRVVEHLAHRLLDREVTPDEALAASNAAALLASEFGRLELPGIAQLARHLVKTLSREGLGAADAVHMSGTTDDIRTLLDSAIAQQESTLDSRGTIVAVGPASAELDGICWVLATRGHSLVHDSDRLAAPASAPSGVLLAAGDSAAATSALLQAIGESWAVPIVALYDDTRPETLRALAARCATILPSTVSAEVISAEFARYETARHLAPVLYAHGRIARDAGGLLRAHGFRIRRAREIDALPGLLGQENAAVVFGDTAAPKDVVAIARVIRAIPATRRTPIIWLAPLTAEQQEVARHLEILAVDTVTDGIVAQAVASLRAAEADRIEEEQASESILAWPAARVLTDRSLVAAHRTGASVVLALIAIDADLSDERRTQAIESLSREFRRGDVIGLCDDRTVAVALQGVSRRVATNRLLALMQRLGLDDGKSRAGIAIFPVDGRSADELVQAADRARRVAIENDGPVVVSTIWRPVSQQVAEVLVVDPDPVMGQMLASIMTERGHATEVLDNGNAALEWMTNRDPAAAPRLLLVDLDTAGLDGLSLVRRLRRAEVLNQVSVLLMTARPSESDLRVALDLGVADIIRKPFSGTLLLHRVGRLLEDR